MDIVALQATLRRFAAELLEVADRTAIALHTGPGSKTHVLVDWENVQPDEHDCRALVPEATDVWMFHGPNQKNVLQGYGSFGDRASAVRVARTGKNALDFHLSFYIGYLAARHPDARLVVLSNDKGYGPMLEHAKALGFVASQSGFVAVRKGRPAAKKVAAKRAAPRLAAPAAAKKAPAAKKVAARKSVAARPAAKKVAAPATAPAPAPARRPAPPITRTKSIEQVLAILKKSPAASRPRKHARLLAYVAAVLGTDVGTGDAEAMLALLAADGKIAVDDKWTVTYRL